MLSILPLIGIAIVAIGAAIDGMLMFAAAEAVDDIPAPEIQTIQAIWDNDFLPFLLGVIVFNWSVGFAVLRSGALPKWLGWWGDRLRRHLARRADRVHRRARRRASGSSSPASCSSMRAAGGVAAPAQPRRRLSLGRA